MKPLYTTSLCFLAVQLKKICPARRDLSLRGNGLILRRLPCVLQAARTSKRKQWTEEGMLAALKAVEEGISVSRVARDYGVPRNTLYDRVSGRVVHGVKPGPKPYLNQSEEKELGSYLKHCAKVGYGKTRKDVLCIVESVTRSAAIYTCV